MAIMASGKDGTIVYSLEGRRIYITRPHLRELVTGVLRGQWRSRVEVPIDRIERVELRRRRLIIDAPGVVRFNTGRPRRPTWPTTVRFRADQRHQFERLARALVATLPMPGRHHVPDLGITRGTLWRRDRDSTAGNETR
jgi:hypothetical protein